MQSPPPGPDRPVPADDARLEAGGCHQRSAHDRAQSRRQVLRTSAALGAAAASLTAVETSLSGTAAADTRHVVASGRRSHSEHRGDQRGGAGHAGHSEQHPAAEGHRVQLHPAGAGDLRAATVTLRPKDFQRAGGAWLSRDIATSGFTMVALTWDASARRAEPAVRVQPHEGHWRSWMHLPASEDGPDLDERDTASDPDERATSLAWVGRAETVALRVNGRVPDQLRVHLVLSERTGADRGASRHRVHAGAATYPARGGELGRKALLPNPVPQPSILGRAAWAADESWRDGSPRYNNTIKQVHVHHTATNNGYAAEDVPALIRGMYYYHTHTLGWSDIAYNFLVDIYGRIWEGRYGGIDKPVRGAHTLGFNAQSTGFSVIGNYQEAQPSAAVLQSLASLAAWKLTPYGRDPLGSTTVTSEGSDKFGNGAKVSLPVIDGHRDTNDTECPGSYLYAQIPAIRAMTKVGMGQGTISIASPFTVAGELVVGQSVSVAPGSYSPADATLGYTWQRDGADIPGAVSSTYLIDADDVGHELSVVVTLSHALYVTATQSVATAASVVGSPAMRLVGHGHSDGRMRILVKVDAPGVRAAGGTVVVTANLDGVKHRRVVKVGRGRAVARFVGLPPGRYYVNAAYSGSPRIQAGRVHVHVKVPRHGKSGKK